MQDTDRVKDADRIKMQDIMKTIMSCQSLTELDLYLKSLRERVTELSPVECVGAIRSSYTASGVSKEWPLLLEAIREHLLTSRPEKEVASMLRGLDRPYVRTIW